MKTVRGASSHVTVNGLNLRYEVAGSGSKVGLCLPGALGESTFRSLIHNDVLLLNCGYFTPVLFL
ncbi:hypothetical protein E2C01_024138 [Portunus trituberculatus]|uniref:Uncharacterized protein n=1 Tax=Portunus trituberculatus TaxID=210409 RepID=A0A5B7EBT2_PORTR|nr:hypothetical protein [Portunus trituberculatus]